MYLTGLNIINKRARQKSFLSLANQIITIILAAVLIFSGINKTIAPLSLIESLSIVFKFFPKDLLLIVATVLPLIEIILGTALIFSLYKESLSKYKKIINLSAVVLFGLFFVYGIYGNIIGLKNDCGCFGNSLKSDFNTNMVTRNSFLFLATVFVIS